MHCSFCRAPQSKARKLISHPSGYPRAYICDECVAVCAMILEGDPPAAASSAESHPLLQHPLAGEFLAAVEAWIRREALTGTAAEEFAAMRDLAVRMTSGKG